MSTQTAAAPAAQGYRGTNKLLVGIVLGVVTFWLFAGTTGTIAPVIKADTGIDVNMLNLAVSITALFSGIFIVAFGGLADRIGRVKVALAGNILGILGSLLIVLVGFVGPAGAWILLGARAIQGLSAACIMPATMALVKAYWDGKDRQRAVSMWSIGSWGGSGFAALFGGLFSAKIISGITWPAIFVASAIISAISFALIMGTPESKVVSTGPAKKFDLPGLAVFLVSMVALMVVLIFGAKIGWTSLTTLILLIVAIVGLTFFVIIEKRTAAPFVDFKLFKNSTFTGATISNFLLNGTIGILIISQQLLQLAGCKVRNAADPLKCDKLLSSWDAGLLTIGYGITIVAMIRVGEMLLRRYGPRKPMIWGSLIVAVSCAMLMMTQLMVEQYEILSVIAYILFGLGLAFYATPSTDAALANLPADQAGAGAGIYKMASSLGGAIGAAISLAIFTGMSGLKSTIIGDIVTFEGIQSNVPIRSAASVSLGFNLLLLVIAVSSIMLTVPKGREKETV